MTWNLISFCYGSDFFVQSQNFISILAEENGVKVFKYGVDDLKNTKIYKENKNYFTQENKYGWCSWKPLFVLETMKKLNEGDKIVLCDIEDIFHPHLYDYVDNVMGDDPYLFIVGGGVQKATTKRDCFVYMDCDSEDYWNSPPLEAGVTFWKVCDESKRILYEWLNYCLDERVNGEDSKFSGKNNFEEFSGWSGKDQSILTNLAIRDGLPVDNGTIRQFIECNADYWYQRNSEYGFTLNRPIDSYLKEIEYRCPYIKINDTLHSVILTVHNKEFLIEKVLLGIVKNTIGNYELIVVLDGCTDRSFDIVKDFFEKYGKNVKYKIIETPDVFETKANNAGLKIADGDYVIIVQDDIIINENGWNKRMQKPFVKFDDVFAVTARTAHNFVLNPNSVHLGMVENLDDCWCDILISTDEADCTNIPRDTFAVRSTVNRGPLMINHNDLKKLNYLDEEFSPQDMDDHDLMYRMYKELGKVCGCYWIDYETKNEWGGTRIGGSPASWLLKSHHKNAKIFYKRNKNILASRKIIENRKVS